MERKYVGNTEICDRNCDLEDQPILYVNSKKPEHHGWARVKCSNCPFDKQDVSKVDRRKQ